ncbi:tRNA epoxyqueuosine(34) reductase QueG [Clostridiisalibacter paucivorans]|uniref:tRNA epoxyqueuosine(34) reductase QueG n=1 Tax=Clostridiisalibacter paucivorans TaxID=408753 RepID=UPI00047ECA49|nr:tRNA epoxyqueuosine(34) reductase QueG [Clostridiisalibacter paucivorans]
MDLKNYIIDSSKRHDIDIIGFADGENMDELQSILMERHIKGYETEFEEDDISKRTDISSIMEGAKSIIVIGMSYNTSEKYPYKFQGAKGYISRSSWGIDYHKVLNERLNKIAEDIKKINHFRYKIFVDTGPLVDREIAKRAGIGWYGKNCSIINDEYGSFIFIGYMITDLILESSPKVNGKCEGCDICIKACPTGALIDGYKINAKRCISYLTQTKNRIPYELRKKMGMKIYGCDTCQLVCPKNKGIEYGNHMEFVPSISEGHINLLEFLDISKKEFNIRFGHMSGSWRGKNILRRNAIIALGNTKDKKYINVLKKYIYDKSPLIREYTAWALLNIDYNMGKSIVEDAMENEKEGKIREEMKKLIIYVKKGQE